MAKKIYAGINEKARNVPKLYFGVNGVARKITKGYAGINGVARLDYTATPPRPPRLPDGYNELEYITANKAQYINTGKASGYNITAKIKARVSENSGANTSAQLFYSNYSYEVGGGFNVAYFSAYTPLAVGNIYVRCGYSPYYETSNKVPSLLVASGIYIPFELTLDGKGNVYFNNLHYTTGNLSAIQSMGVMSTITLGPKVDFQTSIPPTVDIYYFQIYDNETLVRDFVPCKTDANIVGMYDLVSKSFFQSASGTPFAAGPLI